MNKGRNAHYFEQKAMKATEAMNHTVEMHQLYEDEIEKAVRQSSIFEPTFGFGSNNGKIPNYNVIPSDSVSGVFDARANCEGNIGVLNFASYKEPGGMFLQGSIAQEECLCHESFLYNVLSNSELAHYYEWNNEHKNRALYLNRAIWTPDVLFIRGENKVKCDVVTCAAPNKFTAQKYCNVTDEENRNVLYDRIRFVLDIFARQHVQVPVLGAWGAGVFGQNAKEVAEIFKEHLDSGRYHFDIVVFAILPGPNFDAFKEVFENEV